MSPVNVLTAEIGGFLLASEALAAAIVVYLARVVRQSLDLHSVKASTSITVAVPEGPKPPQTAAPADDTAPAGAATTTGSSAP